MRVSVSRVDVDSRVWRVGQEVSAQMSTYQLIAIYKAGDEVRLGQVSANTAVYSKETYWMKRSRCDSVRLERRWACIR